MSDVMPLPSDSSLSPRRAGAAGEGAYHRGLHVVAILTAIATFPLIFMGGLVTSHGAGMSVPDWPNSYGYNMFTFPPNQWIGGIFYEHTHRLAGTVVGMLAIALVIWAWYREKRRWVRWLALSVLLAVIVQGVLGGLRVIWVNLDLAIVHACIAQAFFCLTGLMVAATSRWWHEQPVVDTPGEGGRVLLRLAGIVTLLIYLQLIAGAVMRHYQAGLAIPDLPWAYGQYLPPTTAEGLQAVNQWRAWHPELRLEPVTLAQVWIHFTHRIGAVLVSLGVIVLAIHVAWRHADRALIVRPTWLLTLLLFGQLVLGVLTVLWQKPADITSYHVAVGALALLVTFTIGVRAARLYGVGNVRGAAVQPVSPLSSTQSPLMA
ncbi:MAG TPA: COX15/CtaA family protein [Tepidisphaeraceae bacterium]|nr:COX15/CtaA family protein [Tepidisphaeraceae bacterium]